MMTRLRAVKFAVTCVFIFLLCFVFYLEIIKCSGFRRLSDKNCVRLLPQEGARGRIIDAGAQEIVGNRLCYDLYLMSGNIDDLGAVLKRIEPVLQISAAKLKEIFRKNFLSTSALVCIARNISAKKAIALEEIGTQLSGIVILPRPQRLYPYGKLAAHVIGYIGQIDRWRLTKLQDYGYKTKDMVGFGGAEEKYDYYLRQEEGGLSIEVDSRGKFVRALGFRPPDSGKDIQLTLDIKIQRIAEDCLGERKGAVIVMEPSTGEIIAMASFPNFAPEAFINREDDYLRRLFADSQATMCNRAISSAYPAGSMFKLVVAAAALESGKIKPSTTFNCPGKISIGRGEFNCWDTHDAENLTDAIAHSCNVYFYRTGLLLGPQAIHDWAVKFGFSRITDFNLPYETAGFIPNPLWRKIYRFKNWYDGDTLNFSIGQGEVLVTPLQVARMMAVFANGGTLVSPHIVKQIGGCDLSGQDQHDESLRLKKQTIETLRQGLRNVVVDTGGTAHALSGLSVSVAGKTGSAQAPPGLAHGWFAGYFPYNDPKFVICVFLERGGAGYYAALVAKQMIEKMQEQGLI